MLKTPVFMDPCELCSDSARLAALPWYKLSTDVVPSVKDPVMDEKAFQEKLANLMGEINTLPESERQKLANLAQQTRERHDKMKKTVNDLQESLDYLRLSIKYLVFDLEATRRENKYLRDMLSKQDAGDDPSREDDGGDINPL